MYSVHSTRAHTHTRRSSVGNFFRSTNVSEVRRVSPHACARPPSAPTCPVSKAHRVLRHEPPLQLIARHPRGALFSHTHAPIVFNRSGSARHVCARRPRVSAPSTATWRPPRDRSESVLARAVQQRATSATPLDEAFRTAFARPRKLRRALRVLHASAGETVNVYRILHARAATRRVRIGRDRFRFLELQLLTSFTTLKKRCLSKTKFVPRAKRPNIGLLHSLHVNTIEDSIAGQSLEPRCFSTDFGSWLTRG